MKKTLIALMALASAVYADVQSGTATLTPATTVGSSYYTLDDSTPYDYLYGVFNEGGTCVITMNLHSTGTNCGAYQSIFHVGKDGTGFSIYANGGPAILVTEKHDTNARHEASGMFPVNVEGDYDITITLTGNGEGTASVSLVSSLNPATTKTVDDLSWDTMNWSTDAAQRNKYSIGCYAPGWSGNQLQTLTLKDNAITMTYTAKTPEPATATLSLLALAGLAARRRRH